MKIIDSNKLCLTYPEIIPHDFIFQCGEGWEDLLHGLLHIIDNHCAQHDTQFYLLQVKEKFGTLRFYYNGGDAYIDGAVRLAERMSNSICETCGEKGKHQIRGGWITVRCGAHL